MNPYRDNGLVKQRIEKIWISWEDNRVKRLQELINTRRNEGLYLSSQSCIDNIVRDGYNGTQFFLVFDEL